MPSSVVVFFPIKEFVIFFLKTLKLNIVLFKLLRFVLILLRTRDEIFVLSIKQTQQISPKKMAAYIKRKEGCYSVVTIPRIHHPLFLHVSDIANHFS